MQAFLRLITKEEGNEKVFLVGHDIGALLAIDYSIQFPNEIAGVIAIAPLFLQSQGQVARFVSLFVWLNSKFFVGFVVDEKDGDIIDEHTSNLFTEAFSVNGFKYFTSEPSAISNWQMDSFFFYDYNIETIKEVLKLLDCFVCCLSFFVELTFFFVFL